MLIGLIGPPAAGKGTLAKLIEREFGLKHLSIGEMLRKANSPNYPISKISKGIMAEDEFVIDLLTKHLNPGTLLDGFPRTLSQAESIRSGKIPLKLILNIQCDKEILKERSKNRLIHPSSGRTYHAIFNPPSSPMRDELTGEQLVARPDDDPTVFESRLATHNEAIAMISEALSSIVIDTPSYNTSLELFAKFVQPLLNKVLNTKAN